MCPPITHFTGYWFFHACSLVNDVSIVRCEHHASTEIEYFNIVLDRHDVVFAEGAACETQLHVRDSASNYGEYVRLHGEPANNQTPCVTRVCYDGGRAQLKGYLRSALSPFVDVRRPIDIVRDRLEERALADSV